VDGSHVDLTRLGETWFQRAGAIHQPSAEFTAPRGLHPVSHRGRGGELGISNMLIGAARFQLSASSHVFAVATTGGS
jgi:hypothetical protein